MARGITNRRAREDFQREENTLATTAKKTLADALLAVQQSAPAIQKDAINPAFRSKYISLDSLMPQILPLLNEHGLVLTQLVTTVGEDAAPALRTRITHAATGEFLEDVAPLMLDKQTAQGLGSAITYMRRYALLALLGLVADVDDDGNEAEKAAPKRKPAAGRRAPARSRPASSASGSGDDDW